MKEEGRKEEHINKKDIAFQLSYSNYSGRYDHAKMHSKRKVGRNTLYMTWWHPNLQWGERVHCEALNPPLN